MTQAIEALPDDPNQLKAMLLAERARNERDIGPLSPLAPAFPLATAAIAPLRKAAEAQGRSDFTPLWSGMNRSGCAECSAAEIVNQLAVGFGR